MNDSFKKLKQNIETLEMTVAFQEDMIESLNTTVGKQHQDIQLLQTQLKLLSEFVKNLKNQNEHGIKYTDEEVPPPHY